MSHKHPRHRRIPSTIIAHPLYQASKASSKYGHRYDMRENVVIFGLHIFEWMVVGIISIVVLVFTALFLDTFLG